MINQKNFQFAPNKIGKKEIIGSWKVLIVDDEQEVHTVTKSVLRDFEYENKELEFLDAYSAEEAKKIMVEENNIAIVLLDVVMETDDAGLEVAHYIREELQNNFVQIILRTGQPGSAPEKKVIRDYEINDYKEKTELTSNKLFTVILTALRAYKSLVSLEKNRLGLEKIIDSTRALFRNQEENRFIEGVLIQMEALLNLDDDSLYVKHSGFSAIHKKGDNYIILASTGKFKNDTKITNGVKESLEKAIELHSSFFEDDIYVGYLRVSKDVEHFIYFQGCTNLSESSKKMVDIFASKVTIALENLYLNREIVDTKREIINTLGNVVESRSKETAYHVQRMSEIAYFLAKKYGLDEEEAMMLKNATPMHDVGKVGIPDSILLKQGRLSEEEFEIMKTHAQMGYDILKGSQKDLIKAASIIAYEHHEKYNGTGYPRGLKEEEIHLYGRITSLADVFDALYYKRCYKEPWPIEKIISYFKEEKGKSFDPELTDIFLENIDEIIRMNKNFEG
jgi:response regulator RpfG family c-di-GMP phosphodiesterase